MEESHLALFQAAETIPFIGRTSRNLKKMQIYRRPNTTLTTTIPYEQARGLLQCRGYREKFLRTAENAITSLHFLLCHSVGFVFVLRLDFV